MVTIDVTQNPHNADNTGATNAAPAINSAIDAANAGDEVYIPAGTYLLDPSGENAIGLNETDNGVTIRGDGFDSLLLLANNAVPTGNNYAVIKIDGRSAVLDSITIESIRIDANRSGNAGANNGWGIIVQDSSVSVPPNLTIQGCWVTGAKTTGIQVSRAGTVRYCTVTDCGNHAFATAYGRNMDDGSVNVIDHCYSSGSVSGYGVDMHGKALVTNHRGVGDKYGIKSSNDFDAYGTGDNPATPHVHEIRNSKFEDVGVYGYQMTHPIVSITFEDVEFENVDRSGVRFNFDTSDGIYIRGNGIKTINTGISFNEPGFRIGSANNPNLVDEAGISSYVRVDGTNGKPALSSLTGASGNLDFLLWNNASQGWSDGTGGAFSVDNVQQATNVGNVTYPTLSEVGASAFGGTGVPSGATSVADYGAVGDGVTDDTQAIINAANAAAPDGIVYFPNGTYLVGSNSSTPLNYDLSWNNLTWQGESWNGSIIKMASGQSTAHFMFRLDFDAVAGTVNSATWKKLTLDGDENNQNNRIGIGIKTEGNSITGDVVLEDVFITQWAVNGFEVESGVPKVNRCQFDDCADQSLALSGFAGHGAYVRGNAAPVGAGAYFRNSIFSNNEGAAIDFDTGECLIEDCVMYADGVGGREYAAGLKQNVNTDYITLRRVHMYDLNRQGVKEDAGETGDAGILEFDNVLIERTGLPGVFMPVNITYRGDQLSLREVDNTDFRNAGFYTQPNDTASANGNFDNFGTLSIHNVGSLDNGSAFQLSNMSGNITELIYGGGTTTVGTTANVTIGATTNGASLSPTVPLEADIGPGSGATVTPPPEPEPEPEPSPGGVIRTTGGARVTDAEGVNQTTAGTGGVYTKVIDSFEDGDMSEYNFSTTNKGVPSTDTTFEGLWSYRIENTGFMEHLSTPSASPALDQYFPKGNIARAKLRSTVLSGYTAFAFGVVDQSNFYMAAIDWLGGNLNIWRRDSANGYTQLNSIGVGISNNNWYEIRVKWDDGTMGGANNDITVELRDADNQRALLTSFTFNDATHAAGSGVGIVSNGFDQNGEVSYVDHIVLETDTPPVQGIIPEDMFAYYTLNGTTVDSTANNYDGTAFNTSYVTGINGLDAIQMDLADGSYVKLPSMPLTDGSYTISMWVYPYSWDTRNGLTILGQSGSGQIQLGNEGSFGLRFIYYDGASSRGVNNVSLPALNEWTHVVAMYDDSTGDWSIYLNNSLAGTANAPANLTFGDQSTNYIGSIGGFEPSFDGKIAQARYYDRTLTAAERKGLFENPNGAGENYGQANYGDTQYGN